MLSDSAILKHIGRQPKHAAGFKQLVRELGLRGDERRELNERLQKMVAAGALVAVGQRARFVATQEMVDEVRRVGALRRQLEHFARCRVP